MLVTKKRKEKQILVINHRDEGIGVHDMEFSMGGGIGNVMVLIDTHAYALIRDIFWPTKT